MVEELEKTYKNNLDVKNALKQFKQGRYNSTLLKGLLKYDPNFFDEEYLQAQAISEYEKQTGNIRGLTRQNMQNLRFDIDGDEYEQLVQQQNAQEEDEERYDMSELGDDDEKNEEY